MVGTVSRWRVGVTSCLATACVARPPTAQSPSNQSMASSTAAMVFSSSIGAPQSTTALKRGSINPWSWAGDHGGTALDITATTAKVTWTLNEPATGQVEYGMTTSYGQNSAMEVSFQYTTHLQQLFGLTPATHYHYCVHSKNPAGAETVSSDFEFTTLGAVGPLCHGPTPTSTLVVNVKDTGALGNGATNDTRAIQTAIHQVEGTGGTVWVPRGIYLVDAVVSVNLLSNMTFKMDMDAVLKAIPNDQGGYNIIKIENATHVMVCGGTVLGERHQHLVPGDHVATVPSTGGEWGMGIGIFDSTDVWVESVVSKETWGDGFYVGGNSGSSNVTFYAVTATDNRRVGFGLIHGSGITITDSMASNANGTLPYSGMDIEPDANQSIQNVLVINSQFLNNQGAGIEVMHIQATATITNVTINGNTITGNGESALESHALLLLNATAHTVTNNVVSHNKSNGIVLTDASSNNMVTGNIVDNNGVAENPAGIGIFMYDRSTGNTVTGNSCAGNRYANLEDWVGGNIIGGNTCP